jgi:hypothetical protein
MRGDEARVVEAFCAYLTTNGWTVRREVAFCDVAAERGDERLFAEAKGRTAAIGLDVDTLYGQLLRRMPPEELGRAQFAVVVPTEARTAALRVPARIRRALGIAVYTVDSDGHVQEAAS